MTLFEIVADYIRQHKTLFYSYVVVCCLGYIIKVLVSSAVYSRLFKEDANFDSVVKDICKVWVSLCVLYVIRTRIETTLMTDLLGYLRMALFDRYIKNNEFKFNDTDVSGDVAKILEVSRHIRDIFIWMIGTFVPTVVLMFFINVMFLWKNPLVGVVNLIGNTVNYYLIRKYAPILIENSNERENKFLEMASKLDENLNNLFNILLNDKINQTLENSHKIEKEYQNAYLDQNKELELFTIRLKAVNYFFAFISMIILYRYSKNHLDFVNALLVFTFYISTLENMSEDIPFSMMSLGNIKNIEQILAEKDPNHVALHPVYPSEQRTRSIKGNTMPASLSCRNVSFRYNQNSRYIFKDLNLTIKPGERVAIVSQSGFGKTTLMKLILGFYPIETGEILIDGVNINDIPLKELRDVVNYNNQRTLLLNDTIMGNMQYGNRKTPEEIISFLKQYDLLTVFCEKGNAASPCLNKIVDRNGANISLGMQKVIYLVRGILKDNTLIYIFDEPLTSLDPLTQRKIINMINRETQNKTVLIITHHEEIKKIVDRVINLSSEE